jgi:formate dehydrogenase beta subunit
MLLKGYQVEVFEALTEPGGMAAVGIPEYRLPKKDVLQKEVGIIESLGAKIHYNKRLGSDFLVNNLFSDGFKAVFLGLGAHMGKQLSIPGENRSMEGYISGVKFLLYINHYYIDLNLPVDLGKRMVVIGGGNVAMDCARSALRMGVEEVHLVYRRTKESMPADHEEIEAAEEEGIQFHFLTHPTKIITQNNKVTGLELIQMELGEEDATGRRSVSPIEHSEFILEADFVVPAIGQSFDSRWISPEDGIELDRWGNLKVDPFSLMTSRKGVFAGGDCVSGPATLIEAMACGEEAAECMDEYLQWGRVRFSPQRQMSRIVQSIQDNDKVQAPIKPQYRLKVQELDPQTRRKIFEEVEKPIKPEDAYKEAERCMRCYRVYSVTTER